MLFSEARDVGEVLGRTANVREKAPFPTNIIIVQAAKGVLKLVAAADSRTVVATVGQTERSGFMTVPSRSLLQALKTLKGKGSVEFGFTDEGLSLTTDSGGSILIPGEHPDRLPPVLLPVKDDPDAPIVQIPAGDLERIGAIVSIMTNAVPLDLEFVQWDSLSGEVGWFRATDNLYGAEMGMFHGKAPGRKAMEKSFFLAMRGIESSAYMRFLPGPDKQVDRVQVWTDRYLFVGVTMKQFKRLPSFPKNPEDVTFTASKKELGGLLRSIGGGEPMVYFASDGEELVINGAIGGKAKVPSKIDGVGSVKFNHAALLKVLSVTKGDSVTVTYSTGAATPIRVRGDEDGWPIILAPAVK